MSRSAITVGVKNESPPVLPRISPKFYPLYGRISIFSQNSAPSRHITNSISDLIHDDLVPFVKHHLFQLRYDLSSSSLNSLLENV
jgi:hypothetical protein